MANLTANFMFKRDLEDAFLYHIKFLLSADVQDVEIQNVVKFFISPPRRLEEKLSKYGCWCDKARISRHHYSSCENIEGTPYPSIIGKDPTDHGKHNVPLCPDIDDTVPTDLKDHNHRLGCFKPLKSAEIFMKWFMQQGVWDDSPYLKYMDEIAQVKDFVDEYARRASVYGTPEFDRDGNVETVCRLLAGFWREDIVGDARKSHVAWEAERLLKFLRWNEFKLEECLKELRLAMKKVVQMRLETPTTSSRGGRSRREWERPRRSPAREQYEREESPRRRYRREYSPWRCISPEEPYKGEGSTWRSNPPKEEPRSGEDRYSYPKEQSGGGYGRYIPGEPSRGGHESGRSSSSRKRHEGR